MFSQYFVDELSRERFADELCIARQVAWRGDNRAGGNHDTNMRPARCNHPRQSETIEVSGHLNVGEQELERSMLVEKGIRLICRGRFDNCVSFIRHHVGRVHQNERLVVNDECYGFNKPLKFLSFHSR
jgi:hypothetical protein